MTIASLSFNEISSLPERIRTAILSDLQTCGMDCGQACSDCVRPIDYGTIDPWDLMPGSVECRGVTVSWMGSEINGVKCVSTFGAMLRVLLFTPRQFDSDCPDCLSISTRSSIGCERLMMQSLSALSAQSLGFTPARFKIKLTAPVIRTSGACSYSLWTIELD